MNRIVMSLLAPFLLTPLMVALLTFIHIDAAVSADASEAPPTNPSDIKRLPDLHHSAWVDIKDHHRLKILAQTDHDLFYLWGYFHASDRFFQMDVNRRHITGELAELLGESALPEDYRNRMLGVRAAAERSWHLLDETSQSALRAYAQGVNAFLDRHTLPTEYSTLNLTHARPWTPIDSIVIAKSLMMYLSLRLDIERTDKWQRYVESGKTNGFDGNALFFLDTHPWRPITANTTYSSAGLSAPYSRLFQGSTQQASSRPGTSSLVASDALAQLEVDLSKSTFWQSIFRAEHSAAVGSNWWAVSGEHSKTGFPLVANDPHLPTEWPGVFHPVHLRVTKDPQQGHLNAAGASIPGIPAIAHGQNQSVLWSSTTNYLDVSDVFLDQLVSAAAPSANGKACQASSGLCIVSEGVFHDVIITPQTYRVNASSTTRPDRIVAVDAPEPYQNTAHVPFRTFGPVLRVLKPATSHQPGQALVLQYTGFAGTRELQALLGWMRTKTLDEFQASLFYFEVGSQNWLVTDASGHLAYFSSAKSPLRTDLEAGHVEGLGPAFIRPGDGKANWVRQHKPASGDPTRNNLSASLFNTSLDSLSTLPATEMPHIIDPPSGLLINANNDPSGQTLDGHLYNQARLSDNSKIYYLSHDYADGLRAKRITDRLYQHMGITQPLDDHRAALASTLTPKHTKSSQQTLFSAADFRAIQLEQYQQDAQRLLPHLLASHQRRCTDSRAAQTETPFSELCHSAFLKKAISLFAQWNYTTPTGIDWHTAQLSSNAAERQHSLAATYYHLWRAHLIRSMIYTPLEAYALPKPPGRLALRALIRRINTDTFSCTGASGLDFCGDSTSSSSLSDDARRDYALLDALQTVHETLSSPTYAAHLSKTGLNEWVWGTLHRQQFVHALDSNNALTFSIPSNQVLARYAAWQGFPRSGGYETVNAAPIAPDAIMLSDMISHYGPARRVIGHARKNWFRRIMHSESLLPTTRQTTAYPERSIQQWLDNQQAPVLEKETFMRLRWHKIRPGASS